MAPMMLGIARRNLRDAVDVFSTLNHFDREAGGHRRTCGQPGVLCLALKCFTPQDKFKNKCFISVAVDGPGTNSLTIQLQYCHCHELSADLRHTFCKDRGGRSSTADSATRKWLYGRPNCLYVDVGGLP